MSTNSNKEKLIAGAQKLVEKGQFDKAIREYLKVVAEDETDVRAWIRVGDLYVKLGQKSEAVENYKKVAQLYSQQGEPEKAVAVYKQILQIEPQALEVNMLLGALYRDMGRMQHASQQYELAAQTYTRAGKVREALAAEQAIVDMLPDNIARRIRLAELYSRSNLYPEAAREFAAAATVLRSTGRLDDFAKVAERLLFHASDNLEVTKDLSRYYLQQGDAVRALTKLQVGFKVDRKDVELLDLLAQAFERMSKPDKAVSVLRELARIYSERGALSAADSVNRRIIELDPKDEAARVALSHSGPTRRVGAGQPGAPGQSGSNSNLNAALFNSPVPALSPTTGPVAAAAGISGPVAALSAVSAAVTPAFGSVAPGAQQVAYAAEEEASRVIAEAESFSRFGLAKKAIEHLLATLQSKPGLRTVRERLARLYEAQGQPRSALTELRLLLSQVAGPVEELRLLREIVRLDPKDEAAAARLRVLSANATVSDQDDDDDEPEISVSSSGGDDAGHRRVVPSDADTTSRMPLDQFHKFVQNQSLMRTIPPTSSGAHFTPAAGQPVARPAAAPRPPAPAPSQATQPNAEVVAAAAEEMALTSGTLKEELDEVDFFLQQKMYDEAQQLLKSLLTRYPHSKTVQAKQKEVANQAVVDDVVIDVDVDDMRELDGESTARLNVAAVLAHTDAATADRAAAAKKPAGPPVNSGRHVPPPPPRSPAAPGLAAPLPGPPPGSSGPAGRALPPSSTSLSQGVPASGRSLPPSGPSRTDKTASSAEASGAFRLGVSYRNRGQYGQAVTEFQKALADQKRAARAALMLGLCYRDQNQLKEAIEAFKEGVHMPGISDPDLGELHYQLGRSYEQLGDTGEAVHFYQQALKPNGRFKDADARIATLQGKSSRSLK